MEEKDMLIEAERCLNCTNKPCLNNCPLTNDIPQIIKLLKENDFESAYKVSCNTNVLQSICGRICPHEKQCQSNCTKKYRETSVKIGDIEKYIGDVALERNMKIPMISDELKGKKIAIIGSGPAGLTLSAFLARRMANITIFEKREKLGGLLRYGIPDFRLDKQILDKVIENILNIGATNGVRLIEAKVNTELGKEINIQELKKQYDAIFLSFGANIPKRMNIPGEELENVLMGNELLEYSNHPNYEGKEIIVSGGGNVAIDVARTVKRLNAKKVTVIYRRSEEEMPAEKSEVQKAKEENIDFIFNSNILAIKKKSEINEKNYKTVVECIKTEYQIKENKNKLVNIENSEFNVFTDFVIMAIGGKSNYELIEKEKIKTDKNGFIETDENYKTSIEGVFAGGDLIDKNKTVAWAARYGRDAAESITNYLK